MNRKDTRRTAAWVAFEGHYRNLLDKEEREGRKEVDRLLEVCQRAGIDIIFPCAREGDNKTIYSSRLERPACRWDALGYICWRCSSIGIEIHPWMILFWDHGNIRPDLHVKTREGFARKEDWMCPARPESRRYFLDLCAEVLENYPVQGIHLDYIRYQDKPCYCEFHRSEFRKIRGVDPLDLKEGDLLWEEWNEYNVETTTSFVQKAAEHAHGMERNVSAAVFMPVDHHRNANRNPFRLDRIGIWDGHCDGCPDKDSRRCGDCSRDYAIFQRWQDWCGKGYLDLVCPMNYTPDSGLHLAMIAREMEMAQGVPLFSGLSLFPENTPAGTAEQIRQARAAGAGVCFFDLIRLSEKSEEDREKIYAACGRKEPARKE